MANTSSGCTSLNNGPCGLFKVVTRLFVRADVGTGKVLLVDEAHKRHLAMRVIISTREPTVIPPVLLDLCTVAILHRFSSPAWWDHLSKHVSADISSDDAFDKVVKPRTGEAIILVPAGMCTIPTEAMAQEDDSDQEVGAPQPPVLCQFGRRYLLIDVKTRNRITAHGGASVLVLS
ncbi:hypothetical protein PLICRDRAFT_169998 [Plicaturopsis crispa FD-325 SS-3]|nr:hypothetical protein PLICRDRAFT_169998 [Plicaturopsis crispa FD-325 SS-3]